MMRASSLPHPFPLILLALALLALAVFLAHDTPPPAQASHKLPTPTNLVVTELSTTSVWLAWDGEAASRQYRIDWRERDDHTATGGVTTSASTNGGARVVTGLTSGTVYEFHVLTVGTGTGHSDSDYTDWVTATPATVMVSNTGQTAAAAWDTGSTSRAQAFTTGTNSGGYKPVAIEAVIGSTRNSASQLTLRAQLWSASGGEPDSKVADLLVPSTLSAGRLAFAVPPGTTLTASTEYFFVIYTTGNHNLILGSTASDNEDSGGQTGWSINNGSSSSANEPGSWSSGDHSMRIRVILPQQEATADPTDLSGLTAEGSPNGTVWGSFPAAGSLAPAFDAGTTAYRATVADNFTHIRLTPTVAVDGSTVKVGKAGTTLETVTSGSPSSGIELAVGDNEITVEVTAADSSTQNYTVTVRRVTSGTQWHATLLPQALGSTLGLGCRTSATDTSDKCSTTDTLTDDDFTHDSTNYALTTVRLTSTLFLVFDTAPTTATKGLSFCAGSSEFALSGMSGASTSFSDAGLTWTAGVPVSLSIGTSCAPDATDLSLLTGEGSEDGSTFTDLTGANALAPAFDADTTVYRATVGNAVTHVRLTPTVAADGSTVKVGKAGETLTPVTSGSASAGIELAVGDNQITVEVTASGTTQEYTVTVRRVPSGTEWHATLVPQAFTAGVGGVGCINQASCNSLLTDNSFSVGGTDYALTAISDYNSDSFAATFTGSLPNTELLALKFCLGSTEYTISRSVTPISLVSTDVGWTAGVPVSLSIGTSCGQAISADLSGLTADGSTDGGALWPRLVGAAALTPAFDADTTAYRATVGNDVAHLRLEPEVADAGSTVKVGRAGTTLATVIGGAASAAIPLDLGDNQITVEVTASDGNTTKEYTVTVRRVTAGTQWYATLLGQELPSGQGIGCFNNAVADPLKCSTAATLTEDDLAVGGSSYSVESIRVYTDGVTPEILVFDLSANLNTELKALNFCAGATGFALSAATDDKETWDNSGLTWSAGDLVSLSIGTSCAPLWTATLTPANLGGGDLGCDAVATPSPGIVRPPQRCRTTTSPTPRGHQLHRQGGRPPEQRHPPFHCLHGCQRGHHPGDQGTVPLRGRRPLPAGQRPVQRPG